MQTVRSSLFGLVSSLPLLAIAALAVVACAGTDDPASSESSIVDGRCLDKACGADCTPPGSDEPFNCSASGRCLAAGAPLACPYEPKTACADKACGADCTPPGSDEPFNCDARGACVATGGVHPPSADGGVGGPLGCL
jgi:hypothetical protein